jgi:hypothetical protein
MERPQESELLALSTILSNPVLKELLRSIFAERQVACIKYCQEHTIAAEHHRATIEAGMADAFGMVTSILDDFIEQYGKPEGPEEEEKEDGL